MQLTPEQIEQIKTIAQSNPTEETCGYILDGLVVQCRNVADDRRNTFKVRSPDEATCIWHSHINGSDDFSASDIKASKELEKPYFLYCVGSEITQYFDPTVTAPYLGRTFHWSWQNCYTLFQDYYRQELGIELPDFYLKSPRSFLFGSVGYLEELPKHRFRRLDVDEQPLKNDVVLAYEGTPQPNHVAIVMEPESGKVLHHLRFELSRYTVYNLSQIGKNIHSIWRYC